VLLAKIGKTIVDHVSVSYTGLMKFLGMQDVTEFEQPELKRMVYPPQKLDKDNGLVTRALHLATAFALGKGTCATHRPPGAIASRSLVAVRAGPTHVSLEYVLPSYCSMKVNVKEVRDAYRIPGAVYDRSHCESPRRRRENMLWKDVVIKRGISVGTDVWRRLFTEQNWMEGEPPKDNKELKKLINALKRTMKKEKEEKRKKSLTTKAAGGKELA
jgi:hypothetical protein